ncbi:MAG: hypothetical protein U0163_14495 [Gemmatimonadaceae bacterium]
MSGICGANGGDGSIQDARSHGQHVAEVGADGRQDVLQRVGERTAPFIDAFPQDVEVCPEQDEVRGVLGDINSRIDRQADVSRGAGASLIPSPMYPTTCPVICGARMMRSFWFRIDLGEHCR